MNFEKLIKFESFIAPTVIMIFTHLMTLAALVVGGMDIANGMVAVGVRKMLFVPLFLRVIAELIIVVFRNNEEMRKFNAAKKDA